jgi:ATP-binding cassette subfamily G (WHITE) protein 2
LLDCLAARKPLYRVEGTVRVNGVVVTRDRMRSISGYVPQEDVLPGYLTVWEHLLFHSTLRCPASLKDSGRRARVLEVLTTLDLKKCAWTRIGDDFNRGLSGGERRRVSLAEELLHPIAVLILDEPLTGLDSNSARSICVALQALSRRGTTVLMSIHQPSCQLFKLLDNVIVLSRGRVIFEGPPEAVPSYIGRLRDICTPIEESRVPFSVCSASNNPADLLLDVASCEWSVDLTQAFARESRSSLDIENPTIDSFPPTKRDRRKKKTSWMRRLIAGFETVVLDDGLPQRHMATAWSQTMALSSRLVTAALRRPALLLLQYAGAIR